MPTIKITSSQPLDINTINLNRKKTLRCENCGWEYTVGRLRAAFATERHRLNCPKNIRPVPFNPNTPR